jgi:hypothetical protein
VRQFAFPGLAIGHRYGALISGGKRVLGCGMLLSVLVLGGTAQGQGLSETIPPTEVDDAKLVGEFLRLGAEAYRKQRYPQALEALSSAWRIKKSPVIASMLAEVEMNLGQYDVAAQHWVYASANLRPNSNDALKEAADGLTECKKHLGTLRVSLTPPNALLVIDDRPVDVQTTGMETWILPGRHRVRAVSGGVTSHLNVQEVDIAAGETLSIDVVVPSSTSSGLNASVAEPIGSVTPRAEQGGGIESRTVVAIVGGGLTLAAVGVGGLFALQRASANDRLDNAVSEIVRIRDANDGEMVCLRSSPPSECADAFHAQTDVDRATDRANLAFGIAVGIGVATVITYAAWPKSKTTGRNVGSALLRQDLVFAPWLTRDTQGLGVQTSF